MTAALDSMFSADWLMRQRFPPVQYAVPGVIPEGFTLFVGSPKAGKSWCVLGLGLALSQGGSAFDVIPVGPPRPVLYLALEDGQRRLQDRLTRLGAVNPPGRLGFITELRANPLEAIQEFVEKNADHSPVVFLDTLGKVQPSANAGETSYERDYRIGTALKRTVDAVPGSALIAVHHSRKAAAEDFLDSVSGTQGLAGSADTIAVLKRERLSRSATLSVTSRDAAEGEYGLQLEGAGTWVLDGADLEAAAAAVREAKSTAGVGDVMAKIIGEVNKHEEGIAPKNLKLLLPEHAAVVDEYLSRAHENNRIAKLRRGLYAPVRSVSSESSEDDLESLSHGSHTSNTPLDGGGGNR